MRPRALCIGINRYPVADADLRGCEHDAERWASVLVGIAGFDRGDVRVLTGRRATRRAILGGLEHMIAALAPGDRGVLTFSGHGTYLAGAEGGDEVYDEAICPWDEHGRVIVDDELRARLDAVPPGAAMAVVLDSCFSGTGTRELPFELGGPSRRPRTIPPGLLGLPELDVGSARPRSAPAGSGARPREVFLAACKDTEEAADDLIDGTWGGALSTVATNAIESARGRISWDRLVARARAELTGRGYDQHPQLEGPAAARRRRVFAGSGGGRR